MQRIENPERYGYVVARPRAKPVPKREPRAREPEPAQPESEPTPGVAAGGDLVDSDPEDAHPVPEGGESSDEDDDEAAFSMPGRARTLGHDWGIFRALYEVAEEDDVSTFVKLILHNVHGSDISIIAVALSMVADGECVRIPWEPMPPFDEPNGPSSYVRQLPANWGTGDGVNFFHATHPFLLPSIRKNGLRCAKKGVGAGCGPKQRYLYTFKHRRAAYATYLMPAEIKIFLPGKQGSITKYFCVFIGVAGLGAWPYARKLVRTPNYRSQFLFRPGTFKPLWIELVPVKRPTDVPGDSVSGNSVPSFIPSVFSAEERHGSQTVRRWRNKEKRARILIYKIAADFSVDVRETQFTDSVPNWYNRGSFESKGQRKGQESQSSSSWSHDNSTPWRQASEPARDGYTEREGEPSQEDLPPWRRNRGQADSSSRSDPPDRSRSGWGWSWETGWNDTWRDDRSRSNPPDTSWRRNQDESSSSSPYNVYSQDRSWRY